MSSEETRAAERSHIPDLLTQDEAIALLRLNKLGVKDPKETLRYLRRTRQLRFLKVAGKVLIPRSAVLEYLARNTIEAAAR